MKKLIPMDKKRTLILIVLALTITISINAANYNSSWNNITIKKSGWCANHQIQFRLLNASEYEESPNKEWKSYENLSDIRVLIYNGPFDSGEIIGNLTTDNTGKFNYSFNKTDSYLIEALGKKNKYNSKKTTINTRECKKSPKHNLSFTHKDYLVMVINSSVKFEENPLNISETYINNQTIFKYITLNLSQQFIYGDILLGIRSPKYYKDITIKRNNSNGKWKKVNTINYDKNNENYSLFTFKKGDYVIKGERLNISNITPPNQEETNVSNKTKTNKTAEAKKDKNTNNNNNNNNKDSKINKEPSEIEGNGNSTLTIVRVFLILLVAGIIIGVVLINKKKNKEKPGSTGTLPPPPASSSINTSEYRKIKSYVQQYRKNYTKDQIYRGLKENNYSYKTIDQVFREEF